MTPQTPQTPQGDGCLWQVMESGGNPAIKEIMAIKETTGVSVKDVAGAAGKAALL